MSAASRRPSDEPARAPRLALGLLLASLPGGAAPAPGAGGDSPLAVELRVRDRAVDPEAHAAELEHAARSPSWPERLRALDALARALAAGTAPAPWMAATVRSSLHDEHPNVRAAALRALAELRDPPVGDGLAAGAEPLAAPADVAALAADPVPWVRAAAARLLGRFPTGATERERELLLAALDDDDERVRDAAADALAVRVAADPGGQLEVLRRAVRGADVRAVLDACEGASRAGATGAFFAAGRALLASEAEPGNADALGALGALGAALELFALATPGAAAGADAARLVAGYPAAARADVRVRTALDDATRSRDPALAPALLDGLRALEAEGGEGAPDDDAAYERELVREAFVAAASELLGGTEVLRRLVAGELPASSAAAFCNELAPHAPDWAAVAVAPWLAAAPRDLRVRLLDALARGVTSSGDVAAGDVLATRLADPDPALAERAFRVLAGADDPTPFQEALLAAWLALPPGERVERLGAFSRRRPLEAFRKELLALGEEGHVVAVGELVAAFVGDAAIERALERWTERAASALAAGEGRRALELVALLRARLRAAPRGAAPAAARLLELSLGRSTDLGKVAAQGLAELEGGRELLVPWLGRIGDEDRRTRIEVAIALATDADEEVRTRAAQALVEDHPFAAPDLAGRMEEALARGGTARGAGFLAALVTAPSTGREERTTALLALARHPGAGAVELALATGRAPDVDLRRAALEALALHGGEAAAGALRELLEAYRAELRRAPSRDVAPLAAEALEALARVRPLREDELALWLAEPRRRAEQDLAARLAGRDLAGVSFTWRSELDLAERFARAGGFPAALSAAGSWWRLDARLLAALGERALTAGDGDAAPAAGRLLRAARIGLEGEREDDTRVLAEVRRLLVATASATGDRAAFVRQASRLCEEHVRERVSDSAWRRAFGAFDVAAGVDEEARFASALESARGFLALADGRVAEARRRGRRAQELARGSAAAAAAARELVASGD